MKEANLESIIAALVEKYGEARVKHTVERFGRKSSVRRQRAGAPKIDPNRDAFIFALVLSLRLGTGKTVNWCCQWIARHCDIRLRKHRGGMLWTRTINNKETIRRTYNRARLSFEADQDFQHAVARSVASLLWWRETSVNLSWGFMTAMPSGLHIDFAPRGVSSTLLRALDATRSELEALGQQPSKPKKLGNN